MLLLRDLPKYECIRACAQRFGDVDPSAIHGCLLLLRVASDLLAQLEQCFADAGLSQARFTVLMLLNKPGACEQERGAADGAAGEAGAAASPSDLAERAGVTRATMTGLLDGLEREGFIEREPDPQDRRMLAVRITDLGRERLESMLPGYFQLVSKLMSPLAEPQREALIQLLTLLRAPHAPAESAPNPPLPQRAPQTARQAAPEGTTAQ